jgi:hypothetical protein
MITGSQTARTTKGSEMSKIKVSAGFLKAGWIPAVGLALKRAGGGKALAVFMLPITPQMPIVRVRVGSRLTVLERRSVGAWVRVFDCPTPKTARAWTGLGRHLLVELGNRAADSAWTWRDSPSGDRNRCGTDATCNSHSPKSNGGIVTKAPRDLPNQELLMGWSPASGIRCATRKETK